MKKKMIVLTFLVCGALSTAMAQYEKGNITANAGFSFGLIGYGYGYYGGARGFLPITLNAEYSVNDVFAIGPYFGMYSRSYAAGDYKFRALSFGARGTFHASEFLNDNLNMSINTDKVDIYGSLILGIESYSWKYADYISAGYYSNGSRFIFGPVLGIRYLFSPNFGAFFEGGRGAFGYGTLGITARF
jgi:hypothetical protein